MDAFFQRRIKLLSAILSLPIPSETAHSGTEEDDRVTSKVAARNLEQKKPYKFLMVGSEKSGTSTIFKQVLNHLPSYFIRDIHSFLKLKVNHLC